jgi:hypothetical protein
LLPKIRSRLGAAVLASMFTIVLASPANAAAGQQVLVGKYAGGPPLNQSLFAGQYIVATQDSSLTFVMQSDGNFVLYHGKGVCWASNTVGLGHHVTMQADGNLVVYTSGGRAVYASNTAHSPDSKEDELYIFRSYLSQSGAAVFHDGAVVRKYFCYNI